MIEILKRRQIRTKGTGRPDGCLEGQLLTPCPACDTAAEDRMINMLGKKRPVGRPVETSLGFALHSADYFVDGSMFAEKRTTVNWAIRATRANPT